MADFFVRFLILAYAGIAVIDIMGYYPTIRDLYKHKRASANMTSYFLWTYSTGISFLYSLFVLQDTLFRIVAGVLFFSNLTTLFLVLQLTWKRQGVLGKNMESLEEKGC